MINKITKNLLASAILICISGNANAIKNDGDRCSKYGYNVPVAWDFTYDYQKTCYYGTIGEGWIGEYYWNWRGVGEYKTAWGSSPQCASSMTVGISWVNITAPFIIKQNTAGTGYFEYSNTNSKVTSRTPTEWEYRTKWIDENGNGCVPD